MSIQLLFNRKPPRFMKVSSDEMLLELDASINEDHNFTTDITTYPVEDGANISDHARQQPEKLSLHGFVSSSPVKWLGGIRNLRDQLESGRTRVQTALDILMDMAGYRSSDSEASRKDYKLKEPTPVDIITGLRVYSDMMLTSLSIPRDAKTGEAMYFTAEFIKVRKVQSSTAPVLHTVEKAGAGGVNDQAPPSVDKGKDQVAESAPRTKSYLKLLIQTGKEGAPFEFKQPVPEL